MNVKHSPSRVATLLVSGGSWKAITTNIHPDIWAQIETVAQETGQTPQTIINIWLAAYITSVDNDET